MHASLEWRHVSALGCAKQSTVLTIAVDELLVHHAPGYHSELRSNLLDRVHPSVPAPEAPLQGQAETTA